MLSFASAKSTTCHRLRCWTSHCDIWDICRCWCMMLTKCLWW